MGNNCRGTNLQYSADISHSRSIHSHADDTVMSSRQVAITPILKLEALVAVSAEVSLISSTSLSIFHNIICFSTPDAHNLNYSHLILKQKFRNISDQQLWFMTPWRDLPEYFGKWNSVYTRYNRWCLKGSWSAVFEVLSSDVDFEYIMVDGSIARVHQHGAPKKVLRMTRQ